jgi:hypothetical protein
MSASFENKLEPRIAALEKWIQELEKSKRNYDHLRPNNELEVAMVIGTVTVILGTFYFLTR